MFIQNQISKALSVLLPAGAVGASLLLAVSSAQATPAATASSVSADQPSVAARLKAIRTGVTEMGTPTVPAGAEINPSRAGELVPTWWGNGGWGNWHVGWGNGGRRNGWGNGGWPNGWHNGGWGNAGWPNGWHNFWHNG
jgi:rSAM-associated Gly-rich repeat protein